MISLPNAGVPADSTSAFEDCTVTAVSPLRIRRDCDASELAFTPDTLVNMGALIVGDRVRVDISRNPMLVIGRANGVVLASNPNLFANPIFRVNQRAAASGASLAANQYFLDRMKSNDAANAVTWTGDDVAGRVLTVPAGHGISSVQERANFPAGTYTLSWGGTAQGRFYQRGTTAPALASSPITVTTDGTTDMVASWGAGTISWVKIEQGSVATPFMFGALGEELRQCQRYYMRFSLTTGQYAGPGTYWSTVNCVAFVPLPTVMRAAPTVTLSAPSTFDVLATGVNRTVTAIAATACTAQSLALDVTTASSGLSGAAGLLRCTNFTPFPNAYIYADAEL